ncbi:RraA family protein [Mycolicibacterium moriokaense]|nr:RraA family protein [Mycolicibacterium moriokaense]
MTTTAPTVSDADLQFLRSVDSPTIANAIERFQVRPLTDGFIGGEVRCSFPELPPMVGRALTVTMRNPGDRKASRAGFWRMWEQLEAMDGPTVLMIADESGAPQRVAYAGEIMARLARRLGAVGMVTDGALRDLAEVRALGLHYFMRYPVVSHANFEIAGVGDPIELDGQRVVTGDLAHGDANGIVLIPWEIMPDLADAVDKVRTSEAADMAYIDSDEFTLTGFKDRRGYGSGQ